MKTIKEYEKDIQIFETKNYEFKIQLNRENPEGWVKTIVAFANENGGSIYIGVANNGYAKGFAAEEIDDEQKYFVDYIRNKVSPAIKYTVSHIMTDDSKIIIKIDIPVHKGDVVVYKDNSFGSMRERVYRRYSGSTYELTSINEITNYTISKRRISYDLTPTEYKASDYTFKSLNEKYKEENDTEKNLSIKQLKSVGLITDDDYLTIAGMYFADKCPETFPSIHMRKWPGKNKGSNDVIDAKEYKVNLIEQLIEAEKFIKNNSKTGIRKSAGGASNVWSYPSIAITEALCNAIGHRDYLIPGTQIDIDIYEDRIEFVSPGSFLPEGSAQDYLDISKIPSKRRNEATTDTLAMCNLMQRYGSGFEKILEEYAPYNKKFQPRVSSERNWFTITLMDIAYKEEINNIFTEVKLLENEQIVYDLISQNPGLNASSLSKLSDFDENNIRYTIKKLRQKELIKYEGAPKKGGYFIV